MECFQETMPEKCEARDWKMVGRCSYEGFLVINVVGCTSRVMIAWNEVVFSKMDI